MSPVRILFSLLAACLLLAACNRSETPAPPTVTLRGETMGTTYTVKYVSDGLKQTPAPQEVQKQLDGLLEEVNRQMSTYREDSEISRFNRMRDTGRPMPVSADFGFVTAEAVRLNGLTGGALDVTVGPLVNLWGFGPDKSVTREPSPEQIAAASRVTGIDKIAVGGTSDAPTLAKAQPEVYLDLSSIAKGYGVDKLALHLESLGIGNYLVEIGGELRGKGKNAQGESWRIGIEQPQIVQGGGTQIIVPLDNRAIATSGDYRNFHTDAHGRRLSHIIDPQRHEPISHNLASVSVIADTAATADGLSTALFVLGEERGFALAEKQGLAVFFIVREGGGYRTQTSSALKKILAQEQP